LFGDDAEPETQPGIFHIHIDAQHLPEPLRRFAVQDLGFSPSHFCGHPEGFTHFVPQQHFTRKLYSKREFENVWWMLDNTATDSGFVGYLEGEYVITDERIPYKPYQELDVPFRVARRRLTGNTGDLFRQTEFHVAYLRAGSDPRLSERLLKAGLYGAYVPKHDGEYVVLSMQGSLKDVQPLGEKVKAFIAASGGAARCTIKEERAIRYKLVGTASHELPEIAHEVTYY